MGTFDLTTTLDPTDEQLQALMDGIGEIGRRSLSDSKEILNELLIKALG